MAEHSIFTGVNGPNTDGGDPGAEISLGHIFRATATCWLLAIRYWRGATTITGTQKGRLFAVGTQTIVPGTAVDFPAPSGTGWQVATLPSPVELTPGTNYKVVVHYTNNYSATGNYWSTGAGVGGRVQGPITAPDAGGAPLGLGPTKQGSFAYSTNVDIYPDTYFNGGNYWVDVVVSDTPPDARSGSGTAPLTLGATGDGSKTAAAAATAPLTLAATAEAQKHAAATATAPLTLDATGQGDKAATATGTAALTLGASGQGDKRATATGGAPLTLGATGQGTHHGASGVVAPLTLGASGNGTHHGTGSGTAPLTLGAHATAAPDPDPQGQIDPRLSMKFGGDQPALGGANGVPPPTLWPKDLHLLMYPAGTFFQARSKVVDIGTGVVDSALLKRNERLLLFIEEASVVCQRAFQSLYLTIPICPSGQTGGGSVSQPACEDEE